MLKTNRSLFFNEKLRVLIFTLVFLLASHGKASEMDAVININTYLCLAKYRSSIFIPKLSSTVSLSLDAIKEIQKHRLALEMARLENRYGADEITFHFPVGFNPDGRLSEATKGEGQQGIFVKSILSHLLPEAKFDYSKDPSNLTNANYVVRVFDNSEAGRKYHKYSPLSIIEMSLLKSGNPFKFPIARSEAKKLLGMENQKIVHLYVSWGSALTGENFKYISEALIQKIGSHILIVSFGNGSNLKQKAEEFADIANIGKGSLLELSNLKMDSFAEQSSGILFNDTIGNMPFLYAASDLAIVVGPINFFQPLAQGTKTLFIFPKDDRIVRGYNGLTVHRMALAAEKTKGFIKNSDFKNIPEDLERLLKMPDPIHPAFTKTNNVTYFSKVLDRLVFMLINQN